MQKFPGVLRTLNIKSQKENEFSMDNLKKMLVHIFK